MAQQIQSELDAAAHTEPATFARVRGVRPVLKCVEDLGNRHYRAHFGYDNGSAGALAIPVGFFNRFWPPPSDRGQPTTILVGKQPDVVQVPFDRGRAAVWILGGHFAIATRYSRACPANGGTGGRSCVKSADSVECVCGPSRTCVGDDAAQAPCLAQALAAAKTTNPTEVLAAFTDVRLPIDRAVLLAECQAAACAVECHF